MSKKIQAIFLAEGFKRWGWTHFQAVKSMDFYLAWIKSNYHGDMQYLEKHIPYKQNPRKLLPSAIGSFCVALDYIPHPQGPSPFKSIKIARYARGKDYHHWFFHKLWSVSLKLKEAFPQHSFLPLTDSRPVLERELGYWAGLGWIGKNACLISEKHGSFFFLGEIYTTLPMTTSLQTGQVDRCGKCRKCIDACPTQALLSPKTLDAKKCISYWTIESAKIPPQPLREKIHDWYFGCDICQTVCPWNIKAFGPLIEPTYHPEDMIADLKEILTSSNQGLRKKFKGTPLNRTSPNGHRRNAIIVATNKKLVELTDKIAFFQTHPYFKELVKWSLSSLSSK